MTNILIKYNYTGEDIGLDDVKLIKFDYNKCVNISFIDSDSHGDEILKMLDGNIIAVKYCGSTKYDNMSLFSIDSKKVLRNKKLHEILDAE